MSGQLKDKVAIVTGAAQGMGEAEARLFAEEGAKVVITDILEDGARVAKEIGSNAIFIKHDVTDESAWNDVVQQTIKAFGRIDILVNNAAVFTPAALKDTDADLMTYHFRVNQLGPILGMKAMIEPMKAAGGGSIVNISSGAALHANQTGIAYMGTKWAVRGMSKAAALELANLKIRINSVHPGATKTPMLKDGGMGTVDEVLTTIPIGRLCEPIEVARLVLFLASDASSYMTGSEVAITGGLCI